MGAASANKTPSKKRRSPAQERRSQSKALKESLSPALKTPERKVTTPKESTYSHLLPTEEQRKGNGRVAGRSLIMWGRPRMAEKLLLHLHYECTRHKVAIPWDTIAHRLHPGSSGAAVVQHINRLRKELIGEGHLVPPVAQKPGTAISIDPTIRGYIRENMDGGDRETVRPVHFGEKVDDAKFNLPDAFGADAASDEDFSMPDSPSPQRMALCTPERPGPGRSSYQDIAAGDGNIFNRQPLSIDKTWSPSSSFCSPTRQRDFDIDDLDDPLTRSFETATTTSSASLTASNFPCDALSPWEQYRDAWIRSIPHGMPLPPCTKVSALFQGTIIPQLNPIVYQPMFTTDRMAHDDMIALSNQSSSPVRDLQAELKLEDSPLQELAEFHGTAFEDAIGSTHG